MLRKMKKAFIRSARCESTSEFRGLNSEKKKKEEEEGGYEQITHAVSYRRVHRKLGSVRNGVNGASG